MSSHKPLKVIISGGGTGGHVFPAIAIANELKSLVPDLEIRFIGAKDKLEMQKVPDAGYKIDGLWISGLQRGKIAENVLLPFKVISSLLKVRKIIKNFKPDVMVGVGGYASAPATYVAAKNDIPVLIQEQNSYAGMTNKLMADKAQKFCVAYNNMHEFFPSDKIIITGNPVRQDIPAHISKEDALRFFGFTAEHKTVLVIGGSLGAKTINESIAAGLDQLGENDIQLIWQTGRFYIDEMRKHVRDESRVWVNDFIKEMGTAYAAADVIVSRAGALSISELCLIGKPVILVPSPNVAEDHQTKNALALSENEAALMVKDSDARSQLIDELLRLLSNEPLQTSLADHILKLGKPHAARHIAEEVINLARQ